MKKRILDVCIYGVCSIISIMWSVYIIQSMITDLSTTTFSSVYFYVLMNLFDLSIILFICYTFAKSVISLVKYLRTEWTEGADGRMAKRKQAESDRKQKRLEKLQAEIEKLNTPRQ